MESNCDHPNPIVAAWLRNHVCVPLDGIPQWFVKKFETENKTTRV